MSAPYGTGRWAERPPNLYSLRTGVIDTPEPTAAGYVALRVGHAEYGMDSWESGAAHVILTPEEARDLIDALATALGNVPAPGACLIVFPPGTPLDETCPRCRGEAGDHPAPMSGPNDDRAPAERPKLRDVPRIEP